MIVPVQIRDVGERLFEPVVTRRAQAGAARWLEGTECERKFQVLLVGDGLTPKYEDRVLVHARVYLGCGVRRQGLGEIEPFDLGGKPRAHLLESNLHHQVYTMSWISSPDPSYAPRSGKTGHPLDPISSDNAY